jgi:glycosyltransferase involved in cell wall biosynthesis
MKFNPKISIITIVFNDVKHLEKTILSVINHHYNNIEYIIIDGGSTDGTIELIQKYSDKIAYWKSEPDKGIYDAMNKGLKSAAGDYVWFLNSGDVIYREDLLFVIFSEFCETLPDIVYGETMIFAEDGSEIGLRRLKAPENLNWKSLKDGMLVCHQSMLVSRKVAPMYDLKYRFSADYDWMLSSLKKSEVIVNSYQIISAFLDGGISKNNIKKSLLERFNIMIGYYGFFPTLFRHFLIGIKFSLYFIKNKRF